MFYLTNAFSLNMLNQSASITARKCEKSEAMSIIRSECEDWDTASFTGVNAIGHTETDAIVRSMIGPGFPVGRRLSITMQPGDSCIVAQYSGPRLPEGATSLPEGAEVVFWEVIFVDSPVIKWVLFGQMNDCGGSPISSVPYARKEDAEKELRSPSQDCYWDRITEVEY